MLRFLDLSNTEHANFWAAALVMFFGMLRKSNVLPPILTEYDKDRHLSRLDMRLGPTALEITIRWSKTIQFQERTRILPLPRIAGHPLCPLCYRGFSRFSVGFLLCTGGTRFRAIVRCKVP